MCTCCKLNNWKSLTFVTVFCLHGIVLGHERHFGCWIELHIRRPCLKRGYFVRNIAIFGQFCMWWNHNYTQNVPVAVIIKKMLNKIHQSTVTILTFWWFCRDNITCKKLKKVGPTFPRFSPCSSLQSVQKTIGKSFGAYNKYSFW